MRIGHYRERNGVVTVSDEMETISLYELEGEFGKVIDKLKEKAREYACYLTVPQRARWCIAETAWASPTKVLDTVYSKIFLEQGRDDVGVERLYIKGERVVFGEELEAYNVENLKRKTAYDKDKRERYEQLRREFGDNL